MTKHKKILKVIKEIRQSHSEMVNIFTMGSCMNFYVILKSIYPQAVAYYNGDHIITKIGDKFYDITGETSCDNFKPFFEYHPKITSLKVFYQMYSNKNEYKIK